MSDMNIIAVGNPPYTESFEINVPFEVLHYTDSSVDKIKELFSLNRGSIASVFDIVYGPMFEHRNPVSVVHLLERIKEGRI